MKRTVFTVELKGDLLHGITDRPRGETHKAVMFLHGWGGHRTGPHDMFVKLSELTARMGFMGVRFDFRGRGYSGKSGDDISFASMMEDVEAVMEYVRGTLGCTLITILGICSGAKLGLYYCMKGNLPVHNLIELSSSPLRDSEQRQEVAVKKMASTSGEYARKVLHRATWAKFINGEINFRKILHNVVLPLRKIRFSPTRSTPRAAVRPDCFKNFTGEVLMIHGEKDPETVFSVRQIADLLSKYRISYEKHILAGANHSFYSVKWEEEIESIITGWIVRQ